MNWLIWVPVIGLVGCLFWLVWLDGRRAPADFLFHTPNAATEAGYCLAVAERGQAITQGRGDPRLLALLEESIDFWRGRTGGAAAEGQVMLAADLNRPGLAEQDHLNTALQACSQRAVGLYGHRFAVFEGG